MRELLTIIERAKTAMEAAGTDRVALYEWEAEALKRSGCRLPHNAIIIPKQIPPIAAIDNGPARV
jgi:hypothetical protein